MVTQRPPAPLKSMVRRHYIVRVGNEGFARRVGDSTPNHWHYLSPQSLWGFPKSMTVVKVRADFEADVANEAVTTYIWFLCNSQDGQPGHFVALGIGTQHQGRGPTGNGERPIAREVMAKLNEGFDHWFNWVPVPLNARLEERLKRIPAPKPTYIPTLRRVTAEHPFYPTFEAMIDEHERQHHNVFAAVPPVAAASRSVESSTVNDIETDLRNLRREQEEPASQGYVYLIHMAHTCFYKIGMSLDPKLRLQTLQTGNPRTLRIVGTIMVEHMRESESELHLRFQNQRVPDVDAREWFDFQNEKVLGEVQREFLPLGIS